MKPEDSNKAENVTCSLLFRRIRELLQDFRSPACPVKITAAPAPGISSNGELWSRRENYIPGLLSLLLHVAAVGILIVLSIVSYTKPGVISDNAMLLSPFSLSLPQVPPASRPGGGGGGGARALTPASQGVLPPVANQQFVPPTPIITNMAPELMAIPTIVGLQLTSLPVTKLIQLGLPTGILGPPSGGFGKDGGIGDDGEGGGVGNRKGPGGPGGPGDCCGNGPAGSQPALRANTPGVVPPSCPVQIEPNYPDDARRARIQGTVVLAVTIEKDGSIQPNRVVHGLGYGLDEEAQRVLNRWKGVAGKYNGQAVAIPIEIQVNFQLF
jgi:protein TonB